MKCAVALLFLAWGISIHAQTTSMNAPKPSAAHVSNSFTFTVHESAQAAALLFGPQGERAWAGDEWQPEFVFPLPAKDVEGAVFTVRHGAQQIFWVNTLFDVPGGHLQYVYMIPDLLVTTVDVRLHAIGATNTKVDVIYARTALRPEANAHVQAMGQTDGKQGKVWQDQIAAYLRRRKHQP